MDQKEINAVVNNLKKDLPKSPSFHISFLDEPGNYLNSKIGGCFYWPTEEEKLPEELMFLAQINFAELPVNDIFPKEGMLQFFVKDDDCFGLFNDKPTWKVIYHKDTDNGNSVELEWENPSPIEKPARMKFKLVKESMTCNDFRFNNYLPKKYRDYSLDELWETIWEKFSDDHSKLLGFPFFTQDDPRSDYTYDTLLFQLSSDFNPTHIMFGDAGVANFFISKKDLEDLNFDNVLFNWDCY